MEEKKTFTMLRSFYEAAKNIPDKSVQADYLMAVLAYGFDGVETELTGWAASMFTLIKPNIDANNKRTGRRAQESGSNPEVTSKSLPSNPEVTSKSPHPNMNMSMSMNMRNEEGEMIEGSTPQKPPKGAKPSQTKVQLAEFVSMTNDEYNKLLAAYGAADTQRLIEILDNYKGSSGKKYKSDYRAILSWVVARLQDEKARNAREAAAQGTQTPKSWAEVAAEMEAEMGAKK